MKYKIGDIVDYTEAMRAVFTEGCFIEGQVSNESSNTKIWGLINETLSVWFCPLSGIRLFEQVTNKCSLLPSIFSKFTIVADPRIEEAKLKVEPEKSLTYQEAIECTEVIVHYLTHSERFNKYDNWNGSARSVFDLADRKGYRMTGK